MYVASTSIFRATRTGCEPLGGRRSRFVGDGKPEVRSFGGAQVSARMICEGSTGRPRITAMSSGPGQAATISL